MMDELGLTDRQKKVIAYLKTRGCISNTEYQNVAGTTKKTASRDLDDLVSKGVLARVGTTGRGTYYIITGRGGKKGTLGTCVFRVCQ